MRASRELILLKKGPVTGSCECGNEPSGSINGRFLEQLSYC
jgi:hypothetical protein